MGLSTTLGSGPQRTEESVQEQPLLRAFKCYSELPALLRANPGLVGASFCRRDLTGTGRVNSIGAMARGSDLTGAARKGPLLGWHSDSA